MGQRQAYSYEYIKEINLVLLFINNCIIFQTNNHKPTFSPPCVQQSPFLSNAYVPRPQWKPEVIDSNKSYIYIYIYKMFVPIHTYLY